MFLWKNMKKDLYYPLLANMQSCNWTTDYDVQIQHVGVFMVLHVPNKALAHV